MQIRKCQEKDADSIVNFYDEIVKYLDNHINYPRWVYKVYPSKDSVNAMFQEESQYVCICDERIVGAFALNDKPQGNFQKANWSKEINDGSYMVLQALAIDPCMQGQG